MFAQVVFPLPFRNTFSYSIPEEFSASVKFGVRVVVSFGRRILTGYVVGITETADDVKRIKSIQDVLDDKPIFTDSDLKFYEWMAEYYISSLGEALRYAVPSGLDVESKRKVIADQDLCEDLFRADKKRNTLKSDLLKLFLKKDCYSITQLQKILKKKNIHTALKTLENASAITIINEIEDPKAQKKFLKFVKPIKKIDELFELIPEIERNSPKQVVILLEFIAKKLEEQQLSDLLKKTKSSQSSVESLVKKGILEVYDKEVERVFRDTFTESSKEIVLTKTQKSIVDEVANEIKQKKFSPYLLHGVTGSGKTQIYIELAELALKQDQSVLILVPEISLTPQITSRFYNIFGEVVTVVHSRMSIGERYDSWRGIIAGRYKVVVGARSALFAPLKNIGLIVVDEEHDSSYKQFESIPRYQARDAALMRGLFSKCPVILGSATPSIESMYNAHAGKYKLLELPERIDNAKLPFIRLVDITIEKKQKRMANIFSKKMIDVIADKLKKKEGIIILQNRRGFATQVYCDDCGEIMMCNECTVPMVHHIDKNIMRCHYCGVTRAVPKGCPNCGSLAIKFFGTGTQRVEDELEFHFPDINIERVDSDSMSKKGQLGIILNKFRKAEIDVLVGTQMVSKGLDFSHVTLVGVISAEATLWLPDFRADERTFQLLTQVSGRAGRSTKPGEVIIQTQNHKHFVLQQVVNSDYQSFYKKEIQLRHQGAYPPYTRLCLIETKDPNEINAQGAAKDFYKFLMEQKKPIQVSPVNEALIAKIKGQYRFQIILKSSKKIDPGGKILREMVLNAFIEFNQKSRYKNVRLFIDIDPQSVL